MASTKQRHRCGPRVKTGCLTCRFRRIKCDEARPACQRCTTTGRQCDGYAHLVQEFTTTDAQPESNRRQSSIGQIESYEIPFSIPGSQRDRQLFHHYCASGAKDLAGYLDTTLWYDLVLKHSRRAPVVRQAVIAFSATQLQLVQGQSYILPDGAVEHLKQYDKAVRWLRKYIAITNRLNTNIVLVTSALLFATCIARGEMEEAFQHIESGLLILDSANGPSTRRTSCVSSPGISPLSSVSNASHEDGDLNAVQEELKKLFVHLGKELGVHDMVQGGQSRLHISVSVLAQRSPEQWKSGVEAALSLIRTRLTRLLQSSDASSTGDAAPSNQDSLLEVRISKTLQLVQKWSEIVTSLKSTCDTEDDDKREQHAEMIQRTKRRLSILSLDIWLSILRSAYPESIQLWTMCPSPLIEAFIVLREKTAGYVLSWIAAVSSKLVEHDILRTSIELAVVIPLALLAKDSPHITFSHTVNITLKAMRAHGLYDAEKVAVISHHLTSDRLD